MTTTVTEHTRIDPARHRCVCCGLKIEPGDRYRQAVHVQADWMAEGFAIEYAHVLCVRGEYSSMFEITEQREKRLAKEGAERAAAVASFNATSPIGSPVRYWTGVREGEGKLSRTRTTARLNSAGYPVVWVDGVATCIALTHVQALS